MDVDPVAVKLDFMTPPVALRRLGLQRGKLGLALDFNVASWGLMNPGIWILLGNNATHKKPAGSGHLRAVLKNLEQSGDVVLAKHQPMLRVFSPLFVGTHPL
jgi:hypothetical protein